MIAALKVATPMIMTPVIKRLLDALGKHLSMAMFNRAVKAMSTTYALIVGSLFFMVIVILNIWVQSSISHPSGSDVVWLIGYSFELALSVILFPYLIGKSLVSRRKASELVLLEKQRTNLEPRRVPLFTTTVCDKTPSCNTWFSP